MAVSTDEPPGLRAPPFQLRAYLRAFVKGDYAHGFFRRVVAQAVAVLILVEAIFLAEHFAWVFKDAVRHEADLFNIMLVLACTSTEIFDLALAVAVIVGAYAVLLQMRENRELLVLFASGLGPYQLSSLILIVALLAQLVGIFGAGVVDPLSRYAQRAILFNTELRSLKNGVAKGEFYYFPTYVAYATDRAPPTDEPQPKTEYRPGQANLDLIDARPAPAPSSLNDHFLFVYQQIAPHASRVVTAAKARLDGPDRDGRVVLELGDFTSHTFADAHPLPGPGPAGIQPLRPHCTDCADDLHGVPRVSMRVRNMSELMMVDQLLPFGVRGTIPEEQTIFEELWAPQDHAGRADPAAMRLLAERSTRGLLSFLAPLLALAAVCLTTRRTSWFALPVACVLLMAVDLGCEWVIVKVVPLHPTAALIPPIALCAIVAALALAVIVWRQSELVRPQLARS